VTHVGSRRFRQGKVKPAGLNDYQEVEGLYDMDHCTNRLSVKLFDNNTKTFVRFFAPYGVVTISNLLPSIGNR